MRKLLILLTLSLFVLAACAQPPEDVPRAEIKDEAPDAKKMPGEKEMPQEEKEMPKMNVSEKNMSANMSDEMEGNRSDEANTSEMAMPGLPEGAEAQAVNMDESSFAFTGYGPGKEHKGTFDEWTGNLWVQEGKVVGADGVVQVSSVNTGIDRLDDHLISDDFFNAEMYPEITFAGTIEDGTMTGPFSFNGITHEVSFPVEVSESSVSGDFLLDTTPFNFKYTGINKDVRIEFTASI